MHKRSVVRIRKCKEFYVWKRHGDEYAKHIFKVFHIINQENTMLENWKNSVLDSVQEGIASELGLLFSWASYQWKSAERIVSEEVSEDYERLSFVSGSYLDVITSYVTWYSEKLL